MLLNDKKVYVGHHVGKKERQSKLDEQRAQFTNIFVKNVSTEATDEDFEALFTPFGEIVSAAIGRDEQGTNKGLVKYLIVINSELTTRFGFVNFTSHESADKAVDELHDKDWKGMKLFLSRAQKRSERDEELRKTHEERRLENEAKSAGVNLYVKNLDGEWIMREAQLQVSVLIRQTSGMMTVSALNSRHMGLSQAARL